MQKFDIIQKLFKKNNQAGIKLLNIMNMGYLLEIIIINIIFNNKNNINNNDTNYK